MMARLMPHIHKKPLPKWQRLLLEFVRAEAPAWRRIVARIERERAADLRSSTSVENQA
jgi:hypothetical protein